MLDPMQIRQAPFLQKGVKGRAKTEAEAFLESAAQTVQQLQDENLSVKAQNLEFADMNTRMSGLIEQLEAERDALAVQLAQARTENEQLRAESDGVREALVSAHRSADATLSEAEQKAAQTLSEAEQKANQIMLLAENEAQQKLEQFESYLRAQIEKLRSADEALRDFRERSSEVLSQIPSGIDENITEAVRNMWIRIKQELDAPRDGE